MKSSGPQLVFPPVRGKEVVCRFDGGDITSDAGLLLVAQAEQKIGLVSALAAAIVDRRQPSKVAHPLETLLAERIFAIAAGYEDANDLDSLRADPALKLACGRAPQSGAALASQPTISRLENGVTKKDLLRMGLVLAERVIAQLPSGTQRVVLDVDASEDPCHGQQQFKEFNAYYDTHCYLPLFLHVSAEDGRQRLLGALLRPGKATTPTGLSGLLSRAVRLLRARFPQVTILLRADSGFGSDAVLRLCDKLEIGYVLGLASNARLQELSIPMQLRAAIGHKFEGDGCREWGEFLYRAGSWDRARRVVVKAQVTRGELNPRFVVTSLAALPPALLYQLYCGRGDQENRIKELKLGLASGRTSCSRFLANQFRLLLHAAAGALLCVLQAAAVDTGLASAQVSTLRLRVLKVGAQVVESCRKIWLHLASSFPERGLWQHLHQQMVT